ncbi:MAG: aminopeptidase P family protein [Oscillospiraceae bacterium]|nr:aminopeptidase P family protein [Oscillospiraceae bacterium]
MIPYPMAGAYLITDPVNMRYLHRLPMARGAVYLSAQQRVFLSWSRMPAEPPPDRLRLLAIREESLGDTLQALLREDGLTEIQVEPSVPLHLYRQVERIPGIHVRISEDPVSQWREIKDDWEVAQLAEAGRITDDAFAGILPFLRPGVTELEIAAELERSMRLAGCVEFNKTIVAAGAHSAKPHHWPTEYAIRKGDFVTMDYGCTVNGYHSDLTRTVVIGRASTAQKRVYEAVLQAQQAAEEALSAGKTSGEMDALARGIIERAGYPGRFLHNLGHGIGLDIHEGTGLIRGSGTILQAGMVVSVEPGIYLEGEGGVRIEDIAVVEEQGCCVLENAERKLIEV